VIGKVIELRPRIDNIVHIYPRNDIEGWMMQNELDWLYETARFMENVVEVGCWMGRSTHALLSGCGGTVYAVDHFKGSKSQVEGGAHAIAKTKDIRAIFDANVGYFENLIVLQIDSREAAKLFRRKSVDMIFIDGDHDYEEVYADIVAWMPICRKLLCGHDLFEAGVPKALKELNLNYTKQEGSIWSVEIGDHGK
jgi:hypothetical protein